MFLLIYIVSFFIIKDIEHNYFMPVLCGLLAGAVSFFDIMFDDLRGFCASVLCVRWVKTQNADLIDELRLFLEASVRSASGECTDKTVAIAAECKSAVYYEKNPSRKRLETLFNCLNVFFSVVTGIAFGLFLAMGVFSMILQEGSFFNSLSLPPFYIVLGIGAVWIVISLVKIICVDELETKWYRKVAPDILDLEKQLREKK